MNFSTDAKLSTWQISRTRSRSTAWPEVVRPLALGLAITLAQVAVVLIVAANTGAAGGSYASLCRWDGVLYSCVVRDGYRTTIPPTAAQDFTHSNVAFFPGYPLVGHAIRRLSGDSLSIPASLVLGAQLAAWGFWTYWLLFLRRFGAPRQVALLATLAVALHPAGYYLVVSYSESLFLFSMFGFFFWLDDRNGRWAWAVPHGMLMSATRLGGLPVAFVPLIAQFMAEFAPVAQLALSGRSAAGGRARVRQSLLNSYRRAWADLGRLGWLAMVGVAASLGGLAYFAYCQWTFGYWNMYFWTQEQGATVAADWFWWVQPTSYGFIGSLCHEHLHWPDDLSRFCVGLSMLLFYVIARWELGRARAGDKSLPKRLPFYLSAVGLFFLHAAGVAPIAMQSMFRYSIVVYALLLLAVVHACGRGPVPAWLARPRIIWFVVGFVALAGLQLALVSRYFANLWVA